jgi:hypothetical protein
MSIMPVPVPALPKTENGDETLFMVANGFAMSFGKFGVNPVVFEDSILTS